MSFPVNLELFGLSLNAHLFFETISYMIGFRYFLYLRKRSTDFISDSNRVWIILGAAIGALLFSRIIGSLENPDLLIQSENIGMSIYSNKTIVGGLLGGLIGVEFTKKLLHVKTSSGDLFTYPIILAMFIGRIGCFLNGIYEETYGDPTTFFMGMDLGDGLLRHPVTLYEMGFLVLLFILLKTIEFQKPLRNGIKFQLFMICYLSFRFILDFIKPGFTFWAEIGTIQISCIFGLIYYRNTLFMIISKPSKLFEHAQY